MKWTWMALLVAVVGCDNEAPTEREALNDDAHLFAFNDCADDYFDCIFDCGFDFGCRSDCRDDFDACLDQTNPPTSGGGGSSSCSSSRSVNGTTQSADCNSGQCTCEENGVQVGTCSGDSCNLDTGCCASVF
ncbi:MAG: hypothetical protein AAGA48_38640 [Myxococcota bacterium]